MLARAKIRIERNGIQEEIVRIKEEVVLLKVKQTVKDISEEEYAVKMADLDAQFEKIKAKRDSLRLD